MRGAHLLLVVATLAASGCPSRNAYVCSGNEQCVVGGVQGRCEPQGFCSIPDDGCPGGHRFATDSGDGLAGTCVLADAAVPDAAPPCGGPGEPCCTAGTACGAGTSCVAGSCSGCVADLAHGRRHGCVRKADNTVWCIGENSDGQIGLGLAGPAVTTWTQARDATTSTVINDASTIVTGGLFTCALRTGGAVWCWGDNQFGSVGNNAAPDAPAAVRVVEPDGDPVVGVTGLRAGRFHACAITQGGGIVCWGRNADGELGIGTTTSPIRTATPVLDAPAGAPVTGFVEVIPGDANTCARKADNSVWCWGVNSTGNVGDGTLMQRTTPVMIGMGTTVGLGPFRHACMSRANGTAACWGSSWRARLGNGMTSFEAVGIPAYVNTPTTVLTSKGGPPLMDVASVAVSGATCALLMDGTVRCWGDNMHGQTGAGNGGPFPMQVLTADREPLAGIDRLKVGFAHVCAHATAGDLWWCWGRNEQGELGGTPSLERSFAQPFEFPCP